MNQVAFAFAGQDFAIVDGTALWWPERRALMVADLHCEKASWFALRGQMLPPYDSMAALERLSRIAAALGAAHIYCLGDNFHDDGGVARLPAAAREQIARLVDGYGLEWITGNHDPALERAIPGRVHAETKIGPLMLRHEAKQPLTGIELSGHFHPKARIRAGGRIISRPCFVAGECAAPDGRRLGRIILPAFGALTGGLDAGAEVIAALFPEGYRALVPAGGKLLQFEFAVAEMAERRQLSLWHK